MVSSHMVSSHMVSSHMASSCVTSSHGEHSCPSVLLGGKLSRYKCDSHEHKDRLPSQRTLQCRLWVPQVWSHRNNILRFFYGISFILTIAVRVVEKSHFIDEKAEVLWKGPTS